MRRFLGLFLINLMVCGAALAADCDFSQPAERQLLSAALNSRDKDEIDRAIASLNPAKRAPDIPAPRNKGNADTAEVPALSAAQRDALVRAQLDASRRIVDRVTDPHATPQDLPFALRHVAGILRGSVALAKAYPETRAEALGIAEAAADYLVQASREAGVPFTPFPYWRGRSGRLGELSEIMARGLEACGGLEDRVRDGWFVVPEVPDQYFFDTGLVGAALAELSAELPKDAYRDWLDGAITWLDGQQLSSNFNYNAFPVQLFLARHASTGDPKDLERARDWLLFGVLPGMISEGPDAGHWIDPHNNLLPYRVIMVQAMLSTRLEMSRAGMASDDSLDLEIAQAFGAVEDDLLQGRVTESAERMIEIYLALDAAIEQGLQLDQDRQLRTSVEQTATRWLVENRPRGDLATALFLASQSDVSDR